MPSCAVDDCDRSSRARGQCDKHYRQTRKHGAAMLPSPNPRVCLDCGATIGPRAQRCPRHRREREQSMQRRRGLPPHRAMPCALCGAPMWRSRTNRPEGQSICHPCRRVTVLPDHIPGNKSYRKGCRCEGCISAMKARRHNAKAARRVRERDAFVATVVPAEIFARDRWRCHICRRQLRPANVVPHLRAATIDHLIPLSLDGTHEPANVRTACYSCNSAKGNRGGNEQLLLIG